MTLDPFAGRAAAARARLCDRVLAVSAEGVFLWPGIPLLRRRGESYQVIDQNRLHDLLGSYFGPDAIYRPVRGALDSAGGALLRGDIRAAETCLQDMGLPPLSPNGRRLIAAIAKRQVLPVPDVPISAEQRGSYWSDGDADLIAKSYDRYTEAARLLGKLFHPSWNGGYGEVNWFPSRGCPRCTDGATTEAIPVAKSNFNPDQPRVPKGQSDGGQWTTEGETQGPQANFRTAQEIILPLPQSVPMTVPRILPPTEIAPLPLDIPNIDERVPVDNPFPNKRRCVEEWAAARKFCDEQRQKGTFKPGYRGFGKNYDKCLLGQVSEACGGNKYDRGKGKNRPIA